MNAAITVVRASHLTPFIDFLSDIGSPVEKLLETVHLNIDDFSSPDNLIAEAPIWAFVEKAAKSQGIENIGFNVTERLSLDSFGLFGHDVMQAPTLYEALSLFIDTMGVQSNCPPFWLKEEQGCVWFCRLGTQGINVGNWEIEQHVVSLMIQLVRGFTSLNWTPAQVYLQSANIPHVIDTPSLLNSQIYTAKPITAICIPENLLLNRSIYLSSVRHHKSHNPLGRVSYETTKVLKEMLSQRHLTRHHKVHDTAKKLDISVRQLQRLLSKEKTNFRSLTEQVLFERAKDLLAMPEASILEVSLELGYLDTANFSRAFKRWSGVSPSVYRTICFNRR